MIDIIINVDKFNDDFYKTLFSISIQSIKDKINVILVYNYSLKNFKNQVKKFERLLNIKYVEYSKKLSMGEIYQLGVNNSKSDYYMFLDACDVLYDYYSIETLYNNFKEEDFIYVGCNNFYLNNQEFFNSSSYLYTKLFSRKKINKFKIKFSNINHYYDLFYSLTCNLICDNILLDVDTYVCKHELFNNTFIDLEYLDEYIVGFNELISFGLDNSLNSQVALLIFKTLNDLYLLYNRCTDLGQSEKNNIIRKSLDIYLRYCELSDYSNLDVEKNIFNNNYFVNIPSITFEQFLDLYKYYL